MVLKLFFKETDSGSSLRQFPILKFFTPIFQTRIVSLAASISPTFHLEFLRQFLDIKFFHRMLPFRLIVD